MCYFLATCLLLPPTVAVCTCGDDRACFLATYGCTLNQNLCCHDFMCDSRQQVCVCMCVYVCVCLVGRRLGVAERLRLFWLAKTAFFLKNGNAKMPLAV